MNLIEVGFKYRQTLPGLESTWSPQAQSFYWIGTQNNKPTEIWFAPDNERGHMVKLRNDDLAELIDRVSGTESEVESLQNVIAELHERLNQCLTDSDLDGYVKEENLPTIPTKVSELENDTHYVTEEEIGNYIPDIEIDGSDVDDMIEEKITEKLKWTVI